MASDAEIKISAEASGVEKGMKDAAAAVQNGIGQIRAEFDSLGATFGKINTLMTGFAAAVAGGKAFSAAVNETVNLTKEATKLSKTLGITATEASVLNVALGDIYQSSDTVVAATAKITKTLRTNEGAFTSLGVATRDSSGHFRGSMDIMLDVNQALLKMKEGTDRNIEGQKIYGKSWGEVAPLLKLTTGLMEESKKKAEALGLVVGEENVQATAKYRASMNDMNDVFSAVKKAIGDAVLPILTDLGNWFAEIGPQSVQVMKVAMSGLVSAFYGLKMVVDVAVTVIRVAIQSMVVWLLTLADVGAKALKFDFSGAKAAWKGGMEQIKDIAKGGLDEIAKDAEKNRDKIFGAIFNATEGKATPTKKGGGDGTSDGGDGKGESLMAKLEARLSAEKVAYQERMRLQGSFVEYSHAQEAKFWQNSLGLAGANSKERSAIQTKMNTQLLAIDKAKFEGEIEKLKASEAAFSHNMDAKLDIARLAAEKMKKAYGEDSKQYQEAAKSVIAIERQKAEQINKIRETWADDARNASLLRIDQEAEDAKLLVDLHQKTTEQMLVEEQGFEVRRHAIRLAALQEKLKLAAQDPDRNLEELAKIAAQIEELERQHQAKLAGIRRAQIKESNKGETALFAGMEQGFATAISGMLKQAQTFKQALGNLWKSVYGIFVTEMVAKPLAQTAMRVIRESALYKALGLAQITSQDDASAVTVSKKIAEATGVVGANAAEAASGAAASQASIPFAGWGLAAAAFASVMSMVMGAKSAIPSARNGYDIPAGVNPLTQLHEREMVLPAEQADAVRNMTGGGGAVNVHFHTVMADKSSIQKFFRDNAANMAPGLRNLARNFTPVKA